MASDTELWRRADAILDELIDLPKATREQRIAALADDHALQAAVRRLWAAHASHGGVLDAPPAMDSSVTEGLEGRRLGRWRLGEELGRGGMSVVYRAVAEEGSLRGQDAAVKVLPLGVAALHGRAHFVREQQTLMSLHHPFIVPLYDAGVGEDGTPWLAMERVQGQPIDAWCRTQGTDLRGRIRLVLEVCDAVAYLHRNLVVHRDLKPGNVLVDAAGHVRVLDFGIARSLDAAEATSATLHALTPEYAAPEQQARAAPSTSMDIYALGGLLHKLLSGRVPQRDAVGDALPASRMAAAQADAPVDADALRGDIDSIIAKALDRNVEDRYPTVDAFAEDLRRWLDGRPVLARAASRSYRWGKVIARNRVAFIGAAAVLVTLLGGLSATIAQMREARRQEALALASASESKAQLEYVGSVLDVLAPANASTRALDRTTVIREADARAEAAFKDQPRLLAAVKMSLGDVADRSSQGALAHALYGDAMRLRAASLGKDSVDYAIALQSYGLSFKTLDPPRMREALATLREAEGILARVAPRSAHHVQAQVNLASILGDLDQQQESLRWLDAAAADCHDPLGREAVCEQAWWNRSALARRFDRPKEAVGDLRRAYESRRRRLGAGHAETLSMQVSLGALQRELGDAKAAIATLEDARAAQARVYAEPNMEMASLAGALGTAYDADDQPGKASTLFGQAADLIRQLRGPADPDLATTLVQLGSSQLKNGDAQGAMQSYREGLRIFEEAGGKDSAGAMVTRGNLAEAWLDAGDAEAAAKAMAGVREHHAVMFGEGSDRHQTMIMRWVRIELLRGKHAAALALTDELIRLANQEDGPLSASGLRRQRAVALSRAQALAGLGRGDEAWSLAKPVLDATRAEGWTGDSAPRLLAQGVEAACRLGRPECAALQAEARKATADPRVLGRAAHHLRLALASRPSRPRR